MHRHPRPTNNVEEQTPCPNRPPRRTVHSSSNDDVEEQRLVRRRKPPTLSSKPLLTPQNSHARTPRTATPRPTSRPRRFTKRCRTHSTPLPTEHRDRHAINYAGTDPRTNSGAKSRADTIANSNLCAS